MRYWTPQSSSPSSMEDHVHHSPSPDPFVKLNKSTGCCGAHTLSEVYATLTTMPGRQRIRSEQALLFIAEIRDRLSTGGIAEQDFVEALEAAASAGVIGGAVYDALLARCALKAQAKTLYTRNIRHYALRGADVRSRLRTPSVARLL